jgi:hypothetical protein
MRRFFEQRTASNEQRIESLSDAARQRVSALGARLDEIAKERDGLTLRYPSSAWSAAPHDALLPIPDATS